MKNLWLSTWFLSGSLLFAQEVNKASLDSLFTAMQKQNIGSGSASIFKDGQPIYTNAFGKRDLHTLNNNQTIFRIGSITKTFTATLIMKMVEEKKLRLDDLLSAYYPQIVNADKITISHLLQHRSGIYNFTNEADYLTWNSQPMSKATLLTKIGAYPSSFEPDSQMDYSNSNYILLSFILEDVSKKSYQYLLERYITKPLKLKATRVGGPINVLNNEAVSFEWKVDRFVPSTETDPSVPLGAGNMVSTPTELTLFITALMQGKIVNKASLAAMMTLKDGFGFGLFEWPYAAKKMIGHSGGIDAFSSMMMYDPSNSMSYSVIQNSNQISTNGILINLMNATHGLPIDFPVVSKVIAVDKNILEGYVGDFTSKDVPLGIKIFITDGYLHAQATGQPSFALSPVSVTEFEFAPAKVKIIFGADGKTLKLLQGGKTFGFVKKE